MKPTMHVPTRKPLTPRTLTLVAAVWVIASLGAPVVVQAQLGALRKKAAETVKDGAKKDTAKASQPDTAKKPAPAAAAPTSAPVSATAVRQSDSKIWENYDFVPGN